MKWLDELTSRLGSALDHWKAKGLDYSKILYKPDIGPEVGTYCQMKQDHLLDKSLDQRLIPDAAKPTIVEGKSVIIDTPVVNTIRVVGTITGAEVSRQNGPEGYQKILFALIS